MIIGSSSHWILRHHPYPSPLLGWLLLDAKRHIGGFDQFDQYESHSWGFTIKNTIKLVKNLTGCDRVYTISFGEAVRHLHLHLIPRFANDPSTESWQIADKYRLMQQKKIAVPSEISIKKLLDNGKKEVQKWSDDWKIS